MKSREEILNTIKYQLSLEYNCTIGDFSKSDNIITLQRNHPQRRPYSDNTFYLQMVTFGDNVVITSNESMHKWLQSYIKNRKGIWLFEHNNLMELELELNKVNKKLSQTYHMFTSQKNIESKNIDIKTKWFENEMIHQFYGSEFSSNAIAKKYNPKKPDILAVAAYIDNEIIGMAGCSADTPLLWQIGIDVKEKYSGRGIGTYLTSLLKKEIENRGKIPFYGTSLSNIKSWNVALNSGFIPTWIEISTIEK